MRLLVTSAAGTNGHGYGKLLTFDLSGRPLGPFSDDSRVADPRGLAVNWDKGLLYLNSGANRILGLDANGRVVRDTGPIEGLNSGGGNFGRMAGITSGCAARGRSWPFPLSLIRLGSMSSRLG